MDDLELCDICNKNKAVYFHEFDPFLEEIDPDSLTEYDRCDWCAECYEKAKEAL